MSTQNPIHPSTTSSVSATRNTTSAIAIVGIVLAAIGGLNWGLVGLFNFDLVAAIFGAGSLLSRIVYVVVAIGAIIALVTLFTRGSRR